ncbi:hypothetical protein AOLI_G00258360 [Acnodon oligacanthus]
MRSFSTHTLLKHTHTSPVNLHCEWAERRRSGVCSAGRDESPGTASTALLKNAAVKTPADCHQNPLCSPGLPEQVQRVPWPQEHRLSLLEALLCWKAPS